MAGDELLEDEDDPADSHSPHSRHGRGGPARGAHAVVPGHLSANLRGSKAGRASRSKIKESLHGPEFHGSDDAADFHN